jgi:hypothetical protein
MIATLLLPPPLLVAQRLDRVEACRLACRVVAEEVPTAAEKANPPRMAVGEIGVGKSATAEIVSDTPMPAKDTGGATDQAEKHGFGEKLQKHMQAARPGVLAGGRSACDIERHPAAIEIARCTSPWMSRPEQPSG